MVKKLEKCAKMIRKTVNTSSSKTVGVLSGVILDSSKWLLTDTITVELLLPPVIHLFRPKYGIQLVMEIYNLAIAVY